MANAEHLRLLKGEEGVSAWNQWRESHPKIEPNLHETSLVGATLELADLHEANLEEADLRRTILTNTNLRGARLRGADLREAVGLVEEQFAGSDLAHAKLPEAIGTFKEGLTRVEAVSQSLQQVHLSLLAACLYGWLTMAATTDAQLVSNASSTPLPIIGTQIPIVGFFFVAPLLLLGFYGYFHTYLQRLWEMLAALPAVFPNGDPLDRKSYPRPLGGFMRTHCFRLRTSRTIAARLHSSVFVLVAWWSVPLTVCAFLWRYLPRHEWVGVVVLLGVLIGSMGLGYWSYLNATMTLLGQKADRVTRGLRRQPIDSQRWSRQRLVRESSVVLGVLVFVLVAFVWFKVARAPYCPTQEGEDYVWTRARQYIVCHPIAQLAREDISRKPPGWSGQKLEEQLPLVTGASIRDSDLQHAMAFRSFLVKADLSRANLFHAFLREADLRKAQLHLAIVRDADLNWALLALADLREATLQGSQLRGADLTGAFLSVFTNCNEGCLARAILRNADLREAWLTRADLKGADLSQAQLQNAHLDDAQLQGACLSKAQLQNADLSRAKLGKVSIAKTCERDPEHVCVLKSGGSQSACNQADVRLPSRENLITALTGANLEGADLAGAKLEGVDLAAANLRGVDFRTVQGLTQEQVDKACTDNKTQFPAHLRRPEDRKGPCKGWQ